MVIGEELPVLALVMRGFDHFVRPDFSAEGAAEFARAAREFVLGHPPGHSIFVAAADGEIVGMIDLRDCSHICLFFVEPEQQGRGVGRSLLEHAVASTLAARSSAASLTVNSSPWAVPVYERLGFEVLGPEVRHRGIRAVPMVRRLGPADQQSHLP